MAVIKQPGLPKVTPVQGYVSPYYWQLPEEARVAGHAYLPSYLGEAAYLNANAKVWCSTVKGTASNIQGASTKSRGALFTTMQSDVN